MEAMEVEDFDGMSWEPDGYDQAIDESLKNFVQRGDDATIPDELEILLTDISKSGIISYAWTDLIVLFRRKTNKLLQKVFSTKGFTGPLTDSFETKLEEIMELYGTHPTEPPFTVQRIAEILVQGDKEYKRTHCLMNAIAKLLSVQASLSYYDDPFPVPTPSSYPFDV